MEFRLLPISGIVEHLVATRQVMIERGSLALDNNSAAETKHAAAFAVLLGALGLWTVDLKKLRRDAETARIYEGVRSQLQREKIEEERCQAVAECKKFYTRGGLAITDPRVVATLKEAIRKRRVAREDETRKRKSSAIENAASPRVLASASLLAQIEELVFFRPENRGRSLWYCTLGKTGKRLEQSKDTRKLAKSVLGRFGAQYAEHVKLKDEIQDGPPQPTKPTKFRHP